MSDLILIEELRQYLIDQAVVRRFGDDANGLPQCILAPRDGAPEAQPGRTYEAATVTLTRIGQEVPAPLEEFLEGALVEVVTRAYHAADAELIQRRIRATLNGIYQFQMGQLLVEHSQLFAGDQPLGSDETQYTRMQTFVIRIRTLALAGVQYWI